MSEENNFEQQLNNGETINVAEDVQAEQADQAQEQSEPEISKSEALESEVEEAPPKEETPNAEDSEQSEKSTEANDITPDESVDVPIKTSVIAKPYDAAQSKAVKLGDKNIKLEEKNNRTNVKLNRAKDLISQGDALISASILPAPAEMIIKIFRAQQNDKIEKYNNMLKARNSKIEKNTKKIDKQRARMSDYKKIDEFLVRLKTPEGRRENYIAGLKEFKESSIEKTKSKLDVLQGKIDKAQKQLSSTRYVQERQKLKSKLDRYNDKKKKLTAKLDNLEKFDEKLLWVQKAPMKAVNNVVNASCKNIANVMENNPAAVKNPTETVVVVCIKVIDAEKIKAEQSQQSSQAQKTPQTQEIKSQPKIDILGLYRQDNGDEFIHFAVNNNGKREEYLTNGACTWFDNPNQRYTIEERLSSLRSVDIIDTQEMENLLKNAQSENSTEQNSAKQTPEQELTQKATQASAQALEVIKQNQQQITPKQQIKPMSK